MLYFMVNLRNGFGLGDEISYLSVLLKVKV